MEEHTRLRGRYDDAAESSLTNIPLALLRAELERRTAAQGEAGGGLVGRAADDNNGSGGAKCGSSLPGGSSYNTPAHVAALFLILILSTLGELPSLFLKRCMPHG
jgi:hypothetical protein